jgi:hypothetical protein
MEGFMMLAIDVCNLPDTGGSMFVLIAGLFVLVAGVIVTRWVRQSAGRLSVVVAPLVLLGGFVLAPQVVDPCAPATTVSSATTTTTPTTTTTTTTTLAPVVYEVGSPGPSGGTIFYVDETRPEGSRYFEVACVGWSDGECGGDDSTDPTAEWGCYGALITGADGTAIGTGEQNTIDIVGACTTAGIAAFRADNLVLGGVNDWFLPSKDELNALCKWAFGDNVNTVCNNNGSGALTLLGVGGFSTDFYWSSSEGVDISAWGQVFNFGGQYDNFKSSPTYVRPVRAF